MGEVYRAEQVEPIRRTVALKVIKRGMDTKEVITRFEAERQALALMDHPNIAKVFEAGSAPSGRPYFVMEYVRGTPITTYCDEHKLAFRARLELFIQLCEGVQHAHQKAIIHRDLKPSNVLVTILENEPVPKIIDFGVAKATAQKLTEKTMYTALGELIGTPEYMSPEQAAMTGEDIDTRTDVYALGVILYELLVGALPFEPTELRKAGFEGIVRMLRERDPPRPSTRAGTLGARGAEIASARRTLPAKHTSQLCGDLDWITMRALEKDRTRRYGSPAELGSDIRPNLGHEPVLAGPPSAAYRARKFARRHRLGVGVAAAAALVLVMFSVTMGVQANRIARERDRADEEAKTSDRVSEFLVSVFNVADPGEARGNSITAREVLDNGAQRIRRELNDQPLLRAKMMQTMGLVYQNLGLYMQAESLLVGALELRQTELGQEHLDTIASLNDLGWLRQKQGRLTEAKQLHQQALSVRERVLGADHVDTAWSLQALGTMQILLGETAEGRALVERALSILETDLGPWTQAVAWCTGNIGISYGMMEDYERALPWFERSLEIKKRTLAPNHYDLGVAYGDVGYTLVLLDRLDEARSHLEKAHRILVESLGPNHDLVGNVLHSQGELLRRQGAYAAARDTLRSAMRIMSASVHPDNWHIAEIAHSLVLVEKALRNPSAADTLLLRALEIRQNRPNPDQPELLRTLDDTVGFLREWAAQLRAEGRIADAAERDSRATVYSARAEAIRETLEQTTDR